MDEDDLSLRYRTLIELAADYLGYPQRRAKVVEEAKVLYLYEDLLKILDREQLLSLGESTWD